MKNRMRSGTGPVRFHPVQSRGPIFTRSGEDCAALAVAI
jgi:hypothetical protein